MANGNGNGRSTPPRASEGQPPIAIIGMGCMFPDSADLKQYWRTIRTARDTITDVPETHWSADELYDADPKSPDHTYCRRGGFLPVVDFDPTEFGIPPNAIEATDTSQLLGLVVAKQTLEDGGYGPDRDFDRTRAGVILGVTGALELVVPLSARLGHPKWRKALAAAGVDEKTSEKVIESIAESYVPWRENSFPGLLGNVVAGRIANRLDLRGTNCVVDAACASSLSALHLSVMELATGRSDLVLTGGVDTFNHIFMYMCFSKTPALSPTGDIRPFSENADGTIISEGIGMLLLKRLTDAERDNDRIYAVIRGIGTSSDGRAQIIYAPNAGGQAQALRTAYRTANIRPETVELIEAHGTGTKVGDAIEFKALRTVFQEDNPQRQRCALGSVKSQIGHTKAAAGAGSLIKAALALHHRVLPPTIKVSAPNPKMDIANSPFYLNTELRPWNPSTHVPRRSGVSSFGFGGSNFHVILEEYEKPAHEIAWDGSIEILPLSAQRVEDVLAELTRWREDIANGLSWRQLACDARQARLRFHAAHPIRLVLILRSDENPTATIRRAIEELNRDANGPWERRDCFFSQATNPGKLALLFPGQGSQYANMARDLVCMFPQARNALAAADTGFEEPCTLTDAIFPKPAFDPHQRAEQETTLRQTEIAQPALAAIELGGLRILEHFGIRADASAGHSFGELVALYAAGRIEADALHALARLRGQLMMNRPAAKDGANDRGTMLAVTAPLKDIDDLIARQKLNVVLANRNAPRQGVLSGDRASIDQAEKACRLRGFATTRLPVSGAFHSRLIADAAGPFRDALTEIEFRPGRIPVYANSTGHPYPDHADAARDLLGRQLLQPVHFVRVIETLYDTGVRTFVEVGPKAILTGLVHAILDTKPHEAIALDASRGRAGELLDLARLLGRLAAHGHEIDLARWEREEPPPRVPKMVIPLSGANHRRAPEETKHKRTAAQHAQDTTHAGDNTHSGDTTVTEHQPTNTPATDAPRTQAGGAPAQTPELIEALRMAQEGFRAMQALQQQTAETHQRFLQAQETAQQTFQRVLESQQQMVERALGLTPTSTPAFRPDPHDGQSPRIHAAPEPPHSEPSHSEPSHSEPPHSCGGTHPAPKASASTFTRDPQGSAFTTSAQTAPPPAQTIPPAPQVVPPTVVAQTVPAQSVPAQSDPPPSSPAGGSAPDATAFGQALLTVVGETTGYPPDMLNLDMDIEEDLGIDSIKRVEILAAMEEQFPNLRTIKPDYIGSLRKLRDIVEYATAPDAPSESITEGKQCSDPTPAAAPPCSRDPHHDQSPRIHAAPEPPRSEPPHSCGGPTHHDPKGSASVTPVERRVLTTVDLPIPRVRPLRIAPGHEILVTDDNGQLGTALVEELRNLGLSARLISLVNPPDPDQSAVSGVILLAGAPTEPTSVWSSRDETFLENAFLLAKRFGASLRSAAAQGGAMFITVSRMDGAFGLRSNDFDPVQGGLAGLTKTVSHEWADVRCRALDLAADLRDPRLAARRIVAELQSDGPLEVGLSPRIHAAPEPQHASSEPPHSCPEPPHSCGEATRRVGLQLQTQSIPAGSLRIDRNDVILITGGARGVTAQAALALARAVGPTLVLLGRSPSPSEEPAWLNGLTEKPAMIAAIRANRYSAEDRPTPAELEKHYRRVVANREILRNLKRMQDAGASVAYRSVDVRDASAVRRVLDEIRGTIGPITGLIHGAGVLEDRTIDDKTSDQFNTVFSTKVVGLRTLLNALAQDHLRCLVLFSSVTARFGRQGQVDYAMANEVLNKVAHRQAALRPECRVVAINWGPWDGGMVTPALRREFERLGVGLIPLEAGGACMVDELRESAGNAVEVILGSGFETEGDASEHDEPKTKQQDDINGSELAPVFERCIELDRFPILNSHRIEGRPVLPFALISEWLAHAALHGNPGLHLLGLNEQHVFKGVILDGSAPTVRLLAGKPKRNGNEIEVSVELRSQADDGTDVLHAGATAVLVDRLPDPPPFEIPPGLDVQPYPRTVRSAYDDILFHGQDLHGIERIQGLSPAGMILRTRPAPRPHAWMNHPVRTEWITDPLAVDVAYQAGILWAFEQNGTIPLPAYVAGYRQYQRRFPSTTVTIVLRIQRSGAHKMTGDVFFLDDAGRLIADMRDVAWIAIPSLPRAVSLGS